MAIVHLASSTQLTRFLSSLPSLASTCPKASLASPAATERHLNPVELPFIRLSWRPTIMICALCKEFHLSILGSCARQIHPHSPRHSLSPMPHVAMGGVGIIGTHTYTQPNIQGKLAPPKIEIQDSLQM